MEYCYWARTSGRSHCRGVMWGETRVESASGNDTSKQALLGLVHPWSVYASELNHHAAFFGQPVERCFMLRSENTLRSRIPDFTKWQQRMSSRH